MKQFLKRTLSVFLCIMLLGGVAPVAGVLTMDASAASKKITAYSVGDIVQFGSYPQSRVTDSATVAALNARASGWKSYGYYSGSGTTWDDGSGQPSDYMCYCDVELGGSYYRGVTFDTYRPYYTNYKSTTRTSYTYQASNGYTYGNVYWFKYAPLTWRVLDPATGLVLCENIIDSQPYNNYCLVSGSSPYGDDAGWGTAGKNHYANNYAKSSLRQWLNEDFYNTAFSDSEKLLIAAKTRENKAFSTRYSEYDSASTKDKITLLSYQDVANTSYGFLSTQNSVDVTRCTSGTDYAKSQGLYVTTSTSFPDKQENKCSRWWLRSASNESYNAVIVNEEGNAHRDEPINRTFVGVRPAFNFNLNSEISSSVHGPGDGSALFSGDSTKYNHELARFCADFCMYGYEMGSISGKLQEAGFTNVKKDGNADRDEVNYFIASKDEVQGGVTKKIVFIGTIGSHEKQWYSNFDPEGTERDTAADRGGAPYAKISSDVHTGFADAMEYAYYNLTNYINTLKNQGVRTEDIKIVLTGHSRGAATANLLAARLVDEQESANALCHAGNIYAYTFATPRPTKKSNSAKYNCIFNIVNPEDFVTKVMLEGWKFRRYGNDVITLPSQTNDKNWKKYLEAMRPFYKEYTGYTYEPYSSGEKTTYNIIQKMRKEIATAHGLYTEEFNATWYMGPDLFKFANKWKPFEMFKNTLLPFVAKESVDWGKIAGVILGPGTFYPQILWYFARPDADLPTAWSVEKVIETLQETFGRQFAEAHLMETYCAYMHALSESELMTVRKGLKGTVNCPVDVEIYDKATGELVGRIVNNVVDEEIAKGENAIVMDVNGDSKEYWLPGNGDYTVKLIGNDTGTMDYSIAEIDSDTSTEVVRSNFFDVPITKGKVMTEEFKADETDVENATLKLANGTVLKPTETITEEEKSLLTTEVLVEGKGSAESVSGYSGDYVTVTAIPAEGADFLGWYMGEKQISTEKSYSFVIKKNCSLTAKFKTRAVQSISLMGAAVQYKSPLALKPVVKADEGVKYTIVYSSSNPKVAEVDKNGNITTHRKGTVTITCTATNNDNAENVVESTCKVTVKYAWWQMLIRILLLGFLWY